VKARVGFDALKAVTVKSTVFWVVPSCSSEKTRSQEKYTAPIFKVEE
jgi:hypothetical protein